MGRVRVNPIAGKHELQAPSLFIVFQLLFIVL
jgi:hypothetical protein